MDGTEVYQRYLQSDHWRRIRERTKGLRCLITGSENIELHHLNYRNLGVEILWTDIIPLAPHLHREFHQFKDRHGLDFWDILKWLKLAGRYVSPEAKKRLLNAEDYNRRLREGRIKPRKGAIDIFKGETLPAWKPKPYVPPKGPSHLGDHGAKPVKNPMSLTPRQRQEVKWGPRYKRAKWRDSSWVRLPLPKA